LRSEDRMMERVLVESGAAYCAACCSPDAGRCCAAPEMLRYVWGGLVCSGLQHLSARHGSLCLCHPTMLLALHLIRCSPLVLLRWPLTVLPICCKVAVEGGFCLRPEFTV
jgi:hypothetical protein